VHAAQFFLLFVGQLGPLPAQFASGSGDRHALAGAQPDEIGFELGEGGEDVEEHLPHRIDRVVDTGTQRQPDAARDKSVGDKSRIRDRARQPVELGDDERVAGADGGEGLVEAGPGPVRAGQPVIDVDPLGGDTELFEGGLLGGEVLRVGGAAGVADQGHRHG